MKIVKLLLLLLVLTVVLSSCAVMKSMGQEVEVRTYKPIDRCKEFVGILKDYQDGDNYDVDGIKVSAEDWDYIYKARNTVATSNKIVKRL